MTTMIGIVGFIGSGKGTVTDILAQDYGCSTDSFAAPLKDATAAIFNWPRHLLEGDTEESRIFREKVDEWWTAQLGYTVTPRLILQKMGSEAVRDGISPNVWVSSLYSRFLSRKQPTVISDVRFRNEINFIRACGGQVYRVKRGAEPEWFDDAVEFNASVETLDKSGRTASIGQWVDQSALKNLIAVKEKIKAVHVSERDWIGSVFDGTIDNDGTLEELKAEVESKIASRIGLKRKID
jgi:adenylate kinase family enzyme